VVALEVVVPDSGAVEIGDTLRPGARALNGRGDSVAAAIAWAAFDTAIAAVVDSTTGATLGKTRGVARIQARVGALRSSPLTIRVQTPADSVRAGGDTRDTVTLSAPDSLSDSLIVRAFATPVDGANLLGRRVAFAWTVYPAGATGVTLVPRDTVLTGVSGLAVARLRATSGAGPTPDSVVVTATARRADGQTIPGAPITFVVEFRP
jgi:hypothetical protein